VDYKRTGRTWEREEEVICCSVTDLLERGRTLVNASAECVLTFSL